MGCCWFCFSDDDESSKLPAPEGASPRPINSCKTGEATLRNSSGNMLAKPAPKTTYWPSGVCNRNLSGPRAAGAADMVNSRDALSFLLCLSSLAAAVIEALVYTSRVAPASCCWLAIATGVHVGYVVLVPGAVTCLNAGKICKGFDWWRRTRAGTSTDNPLGLVRPKLVLRIRRRTRHRRAAAATPQNTEHRCNHHRRSITSSLLRYSQIAWPVLIP